MTYVCFTEGRGGLSKVGHVFGEAALERENPNPHPSLPSFPAVPASVVARFAMPARFLIHTVYPVGHKKNKNLLPNFSAELFQSEISGRS